MQLPSVDVVGIQQLQRDFETLSAASRVRSLTSLAWRVQVGSRSLETSCVVITASPEAFYKPATIDGLHAETFSLAVTHIHHAIPNRRPMRECCPYILDAYTLIMELEECEE